MNPKISVLVAARKNSKYLAKFLFGLAANTQDPSALQVLVMTNADDTWNRELDNFFSLRQDFMYVEFFKEDYGLGRAGLHVYFNDLLKHANGDWIVYFCEDHFVNMYGWDKYITDVIDGYRHLGESEFRDGPLDHKKPWILVPKFDNAGSMNHIVSRGFVDKMGGVLGRHGWIDSYINDLAAAAWGKHPYPVIMLQPPMFHDFTHDDPNPMSDAHMSAVITPTGKALPAHGSDEYWANVRSDAAKLTKKGGPNG